MHAASLNRRTPIGRDGAGNRDTLREIPARSLMTRRGGSLTIARRRLISRGSRLRAAFARSHLSQPTTRAPRRNRNRDCNDPCRRGTVKGRRVNDEIRFFLLLLLRLFPRSLVLLLHFHSSFIPSALAPSVALSYDSALHACMHSRTHALKHARTKRIGELRRLKFNSARGRAAN